MAQTLITAVRSAARTLPVLLALSVGGCFGGSTGYSSSTTTTDTSPTPSSLAYEAGATTFLGRQDKLGPVKDGDCLSQVIQVPDIGHPGKTRPQIFYFCGQWARQWCQEHSYQRPASGSCDGVRGWSGPPSSKSGTPATPPPAGNTGSAGGGGNVGGGGGGGGGTGGRTTGGSNTGNTGNGNTGNTGGGTTGGGTTGGGNTGNTGGGNTGGGNAGGGTTGGGTTGGGTTGGGTGNS